MTKDLGEVLNDIANGIGHASVGINDIEDPELRERLNEFVELLLYKVEEFESKEVLRDRGLM